MPMRLTRASLIAVFALVGLLVALAACDSAPTIEQAEGVIAQSTRSAVATQTAVAIAQTSVAVRQTSVAGDVTATALWDQLYHSQTAVADRRGQQASLATAEAPVTQAAAAATAAGITRAAATAAQTQLWDAWAPRLGFAVALIAVMAMALWALRVFSLAVVDRKRTVILPAQAPAYIGQGGQFITNSNRQPGPVTAFYPSTRGAWLIALTNNLLSGKLQLPPPGTYLTNAVTGGPEHLASVLASDQRVQLLNTAAAQGAAYRAGGAPSLAAIAPEPSAPEAPLVVIDDPAELTEGGPHAGLGQWIVEAQAALDQDPHAARRLAAPSLPSPAPTTSLVNLDAGHP